MHPLLTFLSLTPWRGDFAFMADTVLVYDQRQGTFYSSALEVPPTADAAEIRVIGLSQDQLKDPTVIITIGFDVSGDGGNWINRTNDPERGGPDRLPKPPATAVPDFVVVSQLEFGPTRPRFVRAWASTPGLLSYGLALTFQAAGVDV